MNSDSDLSTGTTPQNDTDLLEADIAAFWALLFEMVVDFEKRLSTHLAAHDLTPPQFYVLKTLTEHGGRCRIGQIASEHHLTNATMTGLIQRMERSKPPLVIRERSNKDGRAVDVCLTDAGVQRFWDVQYSLMQVARGVFSMVPPAERKEMIARIRAYFRLMVSQFPVDDSRDDTP